MILSQFPSKTANAAKVIGLDWTQRLPSGESLVSVTWVSYPSGLTFSNDGISGNISSALVSGGTADQKYIVEAQATFTDGQKDDVAAPLYVVTYLLIAA